MPALLGEGRGRSLAIIAALALLQGLAAGAAALATRSLFSGLHAGAPPAPGALATIALAGCAIAAARVSFAAAGERAGQSYALEIREALFRHATGLSASDVAARRVGYVSLRFVGDMAAFKSWLAKGLPQLIAGAVQIPVTIAVLFILNPAFGLIGLSVFAAALAAMCALGLDMGERHRKLRKRRASIAADMSDAMPAAHDLGQLGRAKTEIARLRKSTERMLDAALGRARRAEFLSGLSDIAAAAVAALVLWRGYVDGVEPGVVAGALAAVGLGAAALRFVAAAIDRRGAFLAAREKCAAALARPRGRPRAGRRSLGRKPLSLEVDVVSFAGETPLSFSVEAGGRLVLEGPAAGNAELLFSAIQGRERLPSGRVVIGDVPREQIAPLSLRRRVGRVTTRPLILRGSLRRSLSLGLRRRPSDERLAALLETFGLPQEAADLDRALLDGGRDLPGFKRARISLLNACLNEPGLLLVEPEACCHLEGFDELLAAAGVDCATVVSADALR